MCQCNCCDCQPRHYPSARRGRYVSDFGPRNHGKYWSGREDYHLRNMRRNGFTFRHCARVLNRSIESVRQRYYKFY